MLKFYEFNDCEYYALIGANSFDEAWDFYQETIGELTEEDGFPDEITYEEAKEKFLKVLENCTNGEDLQTIEDFEKSVSSIEPYLCLHDSSLF